MTLATIIATGASIVAEAAPIITTDQLQSVGDAMTSTATAAIPVGLGVMAITMGIPLAKKVLKILGR